MTPVLLALGANLGDRKETISAAVADLSNTPRINDIKLSPLRETIAYGLEGPDPSAPKYLNAVLQATTSLGPHELLNVVQSIENKYGRTREVRWGDRTLDIDIILYGGKAIKDERIEVPHPRAHARDFVLSPWLELDPQAVLMGHGRVAELLAKIGDTTWPYNEREQAEGDS
ncbi:MAG TPA: 2-amino-4-hydroxy-6-hydroxymethyldihydropteridine diphosphokinase [Microbacteriaceae bacterium]|nr:2-amino-4-hydroxy-6-hydroxymethyldihydropteridine diphosphokinase [Microbacteriaceae bacterium]